MAEEITENTETTEVVEKTVPYDRFNKVIEERNSYKTSTAEKDAQIAALNEKIAIYKAAQDKLTQEQKFELKKLENSRRLINKKLTNLK